MFNTTRTKFGNWIQGKGWGMSFDDTGWPNTPGISTIDPLTSELLFSQNYQLLSKRGYIENVISNRCIRGTARAVNSIPFDILINGTNVLDNENDRLSQAFIKLVKAPNPNYSSWLFFIESVISHRFIKGRSYVHPTFFESTGMPDEIEFFRPDRVSVTENTEEGIFRYRFSKGSRQEIYGRDEAGYFDIIDWRMFHPTSDTEGLGQVTPAGLSISGHTEGNKWNKQHLENGARNTAIVSINPDDQTGTLDEEALETLKRKLNEHGKRYDVKVINEKINYEQLALTPQEMDFLDSIKNKAIEICNGLDYPPYLLGLDGATFNNQAEAKMALYEESAIPKAEEFYRLLSDFYSRKLGMSIEFKLRLKDVVALAPRFKDMREGVREDWKADLVNFNEARMSIGYEEVLGAEGEDYFSDRKAPPMSFNPPEA